MLKTAFKQICAAGSLVIAGGLFSGLHAQEKGGFPERRPVVSSTAEQPETFVARNIQATKQYLAELRAYYQDCCAAGGNKAALAIEDLSGTAAIGNLVGGNFGGPVTVRFEVDLKETLLAEAEALDNARAQAGDFLSDAEAWWIESLEVSSLGAATVDPAVAAMTRATLRIAQFRMQARVVKLYKSGDCYASRSQNFNPVALPGDFVFGLTKGPGRLDSRTGVVRLGATTRPGIYDVEFSAPSKSNFSYERVAVGTDSEGRTIYRCDTTPGRAPQVDAATKLTIVDYDTDAACVKETGAQLCLPRRVTKTVLVSERQDPTTLFFSTGSRTVEEGMIAVSDVTGWKVTPDGPIGISGGSGRYGIEPRALTGGKARVTFKPLDGPPTEITINQIAVRPDKIIFQRGDDFAFEQSRDGRVSQTRTGGTYQAIARFRSDENLAGLTVHWRMSDIGTARFASETSTLARDGDFWVARNTLTVPVGAAVGTPSAELEGPDYTNNRIRLGGKIEVQPAVVSNLVLYKDFAGRGMERFEESELDLFTPNDLPQGFVTIEPRAVLGNGRELTFDGPHAQAGLSLDVRSSEPAVAGIGQLFSGAKFALSGKASGSTDLSVEAFQEAESKIRNVTVFVQKLVPLINGDGTVTLKALGPVDMRKYRARIGSRTSEFERQPTGSWAASGAGGGERIEIIDDRGTVVAAVRMAGRAVELEPRIKIIPPEDPPILSIETVPGTDIATPASECNDPNGAGWGLFSGPEWRALCDQIRVAEKADARAQREAVKAYNDFIRSTNDSGRQVVAIEDELAIGARIANLPREYWTRASCHWSARDNIQMVHKRTPISMGSEEVGGCFNTVRGLTTGLDPNSAVRVELRINFLSSRRLVGPNEAGYFLQ